jgi:hypothetical protein
MLPSNGNQSGFLALGFRISARTSVKEKKESAYSSLIFGRYPSSGGTFPDN